MFELGGNNPSKSSILSMSNIPANGLLAVVLVCVVPGAFVGGGRSILIQVTSKRKYNLS
jgi:hypothetical protein